MEVYKYKVSSFKHLINALKIRIMNIPHHILFYFPFGFYKKNRKKLAALKNKHSGKRCFIIANGPSLSKIDFCLLNDEYTFGMNRIYLMKDQNGFMPNYLACVDKESQILQFHDELDMLDIPCFFDFNLRKWFSKKENQIFIKGSYFFRFSKDMSKKTHGKARSVTYAVIQLAYLMGFTEVYLIGKDHSYNTNATAGSAIVSDGKEDNHFIKGYYKKGQRWDAPDYKNEEFAYKIARKEFEKSNRIIKDATIDGNLNIFEKVDFYSLFKRI